MELQMRNFVIKKIPHAQQRYNTVADYQRDDAGGATVRVSDLGNPIMELAVVTHEMVEITLCDQAGITDDVIDAWDMNYPAMRGPDDPLEPGDHPDAPYHRQHVAATKAERAVVEAGGLTWEQHDGTIVALMATRSE